MNIGGSPFSNDPTLLKQHSRSELWLAISGLSKLFLHGHNVFNIKTKVMHQDQDHYIFLSTIKLTILLFKKCLVIIIVIILK